MIVRASMILLAAFSLAPALAAPSVASLDPVSAIDKRDNDFACVSSVKLNAICEEPLSDPSTFFEADPFRRLAPESCTGMKEDVGKHGGMRLEHTANMSAINGENIEHDVERDFQIQMEITGEGRYVVKDNEAVYGLCVRGIQNFGSKGLGCTKEVKGTTGVKGGLARLEYKDVVVGSVQLVYS